MTGRREDFQTTDPAGAAAFERDNADPGLTHGWDITPADVPTLDGDQLDWVAALPDPFRMVACGVCGDMVAAGDVAGHVVACASQEAS